MACETPVVAAAIPSITEVVGDAGLLVEPSDVTGLTYAMMRVASDQATRARMVESGLRRAQNFSWDQCARSTWAVYQKAAGECKQ
jgi:alpha-1,3-rhamnosyl/mannosyltransferase